MQTPWLSKVLSVVFALLLCAMRSPACQIDGVTDEFPPGLDRSALVRIDPDSPAGHKARMPLAEVLELLRGMDSPPPQRSEPPPPDAVRLYISGRAKALQGQTIEAARDLGTAIQLDPLSTAANEALGELLLQQGMVPAGFSAYRRAIEAGSDTPGVVLDIASDLIRQGDFEQAAVLISRGLTAQEARNSANFARPLLLERLTEALSRLGWTRASIEAGQEAFERLDDIEPGQRSPVLTRLLRGLPGRWVELADAAASIGDAALASDLYERAAESGVDWAMLAPRRAFAAVNAQRFDQALDAVLPLDAPQRIAAGRTAELLGWLMKRGIDQRVLSQRVEAAIAATESITPRLAARHAIARAAVAPAREDALRLLGDALRATPEHSGLADAICARSASPTEWLPIVADQPRASRVLARSWLNQASRTAETIDAIPLGGPHDSAARVLRAAMWLELGRADLASDILGENPQPTTIAAESYAGDGRWEQFDAVVAELTDPLDRASALLSAQRLAEARPLLDDSDADANAPSRLLHLKARAALLQGDAELAADHFDTALLADAYDTFSLRGLVSLRMPGGPAPDNRAFEAALAALRIAEPDEEVVVQMDARILASQRGLEAAADRVLPLLERSPTLTGTAVELATSGDADLAAKIRDRIERLFEQSPTDARIGAPLALLLAQQREPERAAEVLLPLSVHDETAGELYEGLLAERLERADEARALRIERLSNGPASITRRLRLAELLSGTDPVRSAEIFLTALPEGTTPTPQQSNTIVRTLLGAGQASERERSPDWARATLRMMTRVDAFELAIPWQIRLLGFSMLILSEEHDPDSVARAVRHLTDGIQDPADAVALARQYRGDRADVGSTIEQARAEVAYALAGALYFQGLEEASLSVYRVALEHDPRHVWASNDLGYFLLERNESLDEAARLIEQAFEQRPEEINIIDSLGWLRYKQGRFEDDGQGRGALSILDEARKSEQGRENETLHDHAGDTLWRMGRRTEAVEAWQTALALTDALLERIPAGSPALPRFTTQRDQLASKIEAALTGQEPPLEPLAREPDPVTD